VDLTSYTLLGRSGLRVSPIALGTMTFGEQWGWGAPRETARAMFDEYVHVGGNFIDTADGYTEGTSESWLGDFMEESGLRERLVIATKYTYNAQPGDPNAGGNHRKHLLAALEGSLRRLKTDYVDLYYLHTWDRLTPVDEVMRTMDDAVRAGKVRYVGLSDTPAWYAARAQTLAQWRGFAPVAAMQLEYSLIERNVELEFTDLAVELGMAMVPWSPLAMGLLSGKYRASEGGAAPSGQGRLQTVSASGRAPAAFNKLTERNFKIVAVLEEVAAEAGISMVHAALQWLHLRRGVASIIVGATKPAQLRESLSALPPRLSADQIARLDAVSEPARPFPYHMFSNAHQARITGGVEVYGQPPQFAAPDHIPAASAPAIGARGERRTAH
jgi:aryl-alcohol dehydrogenase-like predicted oxidoreductase